MCMTLTVKETRLWNARMLADEIGSISAFGEKLGKSQTQTGNLIGANPKRNIGHKIARQIEDAFNKESGWLDIAHHLLWQNIERIEWQSELPSIEPGYIYTTNETPKKIGESNAVYTIDADHEALNEMYELMGDEERKQLLALAKLLAKKNNTNKKIVAHHEHKTTARKTRTKVKSN